MGASVRREDRTTTAHDGGGARVRVCARSVRGHGGQLRDACDSTSDTRYRISEKIRRGGRKAGGETDLLARISTGAQGHSFT